MPIRLHRAALVAATIPFLTAMASIAVPSATEAQDRTSWFVGGAAGYGWGTMMFGSGEAIGSGSGAVLLAQVGTSRARRRAWFVEAETQAFDVPSPRIDERFRAVRILARRSLWAPFFLTPGVGVERRAWHGGQRLEDVDWGLVLAVGLGRHVHVDDSVVLLPEISWTYGFFGREERVSGLGVSLRLGAVYVRQ